MWASRLSLKKGDRRTHSRQSHPVRAYKLSTSHRYMSVISDTYPAALSGAGGCQIPVKGIESSEFT